MSTDQMPEEIKDDILDLLDEVHEDRGSPELVIKPLRVKYGQRLDNLQVAAMIEGMKGMRSPLKARLGESVTTSTLSLEDKLKRRKKNRLAKQARKKNRKR